MTAADCRLRLSSHVCAYVIIVHIFRSCINFANVFVRGQHLAWGRVIRSTVGPLSPLQHTEGTWVSKEMDSVHKHGFPLAGAMHTNWNDWSEVLCIEIFVDDGGFAVAYQNHSSSRSGNRAENFIHNNTWHTKVERKNDVKVVKVLYLAAHCICMKEHYFAARFAVLRVQAQCAPYLRVKRTLQCDHAQPVSLSRDFNASRPSCPKHCSNKVDLASSVAQVEERPVAGWVYSATVEYSTKHFHHGTDC